MKRNFTLAMLIFVGMLCAWNYLPAKPAPEDNAVPQSKLLEIREPEQADFEHCAKRAVDFFESMSADQTQMDIAMHELYGLRELPPQLSSLSRQLAYLKSDITFGRPKLISKKSFGEDIIVLHYHYHTDKVGLVWCFTFARALDQNGEPLQWRSCGFTFGDTGEKFIPSTL